MTSGVLVHRVRTRARWLNDSTKYSSPGSSSSNRRARVLDALAEHAIARVEQHAKADRDALVGELRDLLQLAVLAHLEGLAPQTGDEPSLGVTNRHRDAGDFDAGPEQTAVVNDLVLAPSPGGHRRPGDRRDDQQRQQQAGTETDRHKRYPTTGSVPGIERGLLESWR
jgi:hypothetical protein